MTTADGEAAARRFEELAALYLDQSDVTAGTGFGKSPGLRIGGKIFAMLAKGELVVKLPRERVDELVASGAAGRFDPGHGRVMKEWASVPLDRAAEWEAIVAEAHRFVGGARRASR